MIAIKPWNLDLNSDDKYNVIKDNLSPDLLRELTGFGLLDCKKIIENHIIKNKKDYLLIEFNNNDKYIISKNNAKILIEKYNILINNKERKIKNDLKKILTDENIFEEIKNGMIVKVKKKEI